MILSIDREFNIHVGSIVVTDCSVYLVCQNSTVDNFYLVSLETSEIINETFDRLNAVIRYIESVECEAIIEVIPPNGVELRRCKMEVKNNEKLS